MAYLYGLFVTTMVSKHHKIKILFSIPNFDTAGSGKALLKVAKRLNKDYFEPHIMCMHNRGAFFKVVEESGIPIHIIAYTTQMKPYHKGLKACYKISRELKQIAPDIIHSFHYAADYSEPLAAKLAGIPWVYTKKNMNWGGASKNGWLLRTKLSRAIAVQNTDMLKDFFKKIPYKTTLIPRGVDTEEFKPLAPKQYLREQWGISTDQRIVICVANLVPVKGIHVLLHAFEQASKNNDNWVLFIVGDYNNEYGKKMIDFSKSLHIESKVVFTGKVLNVVDYLNLADFFVLPTLNEGRKEGSPVSLLEAMAVGKFVLASDVPGVKDQLEPFPNNLVKAGCTDCWSEYLANYFSKDRNWLLESGDLLRKHVLTNYTIEKEVERCEQMYFRVLKVKFN